MGCSVQRIAAVERVITSQKVYDLDLGAVVATRHDALSNSLILGFRRAGAYSATTDPYPGYRVELLSYQ